MRAIGIGIGTGFCGAQQFSPASLFSSSEQGAWYDPSDLSSMSQDSAGTVPAAVDSPVGRVNDKSGRGNHLLQASSGSRPMLRLEGGLYYLEFDGVDDFLDGGDVLDIRTGSMWAVAAARFNSTADGSIFAKALSALGIARYAMGRFGAALNVLYTHADGSGTGIVAGAADASVATRVLTGRWNRSSGALAIHANRVQSGADGAIQVGSEDRNTPYRFLVGAYNDGSDAGQGTYFDGRLYGLVLVPNTPLREQDIATTETWIAAKAGVTL